MVNEWAAGAPIGFDIIIGALSMDPMSVRTCGASIFKNVIKLNDSSAIYERIVKKKTFCLHRHTTQERFPFDWQCVPQTNSRQRAASN